MWTVKYLRDVLEEYPDDLPVAFGADREIGTREICDIERIFIAQPMLESGTDYPGGVVLLREQEIWDL